MMRVPDETVGELQNPCGNQLHVHWRPLLVKANLPWSSLATGQVQKLLEMSKAVK